MLESRNHADVRALAVPGAAVAVLLSLARAARSRDAPCLRSGSRPRPASTADPPQARLPHRDGELAAEVWIAAADGSDAKLLGPGQQPLLAPNGSRWQWRCSAPRAVRRNTARRSAIYSTSGARDRRLPEPRSRDRARRSRGRRTRATWRSYAQSNATADIAAALRPGRDRHADRNGRDDRARRDLRRELRAATAATGSCSRSRTRCRRRARTNLYVSRSPTAPALRPLTSDGRSLYPVWGPTYIAYDRERLRASLAPVYQIWLALARRRARAQAHPRSRRLARVRASCRSRSPPTAPGCSPSSRARTPAKRGPSTSPPVARAPLHVRRSGRSRARASRSDGSTLLIDDGLLRAAALARAHRDRPVRRRSPARCSSRTARRPAGTAERRDAQAARAVAGR